MFSGLSAHLPTVQDCAHIPRSTVQKKKRIMEIAPYYATYIDQFYRKHKGMSVKSSYEQTELLLRDGFAAIHFVGPYIDTNQFETLFFPQNAKYLSYAYAKEQGLTFPKNNWVQEITLQAINFWQPDVLYFHDAILFDAAFLGKLAKKPELVIGWRGADIPIETDWTGYDLMLSGLPKLLKVAESLGALRGKMFYPGMPLWVAKAVADIPQDVDVCFAGSLFPYQHEERLAHLDLLARAATRYGFRLTLYLNCHSSLITPAMRPYVHPPVFGLEMHKALRRAKIVVDDRAHHGLVLPDGTKKMDLGGDDTINMRMFEATGGGSMLLTEALPGVRRYFEPGKEVETYASLDELLQKTLYYLKNDKEREAIATAGQQRCLTEHNMDNAAKRFLEIIS